MKVWIEYRFIHKKGTEKLDAVFLDREIKEYSNRGFKLDMILEILASRYIKRLYKGKAYMIGVHPA